MNWFNGVSVRNVLFGVGAIGAIAEAIYIAQRADIQVTPAHLIAVACGALVGFAAKWPGDVTKREAQERVDRAVRRSIAPPPLETRGGGGMAANTYNAMLREQIANVPGGSHTPGTRVEPGVRPATAEEVARKTWGGGPPRGGPGGES